MILLALACGTEPPPALPPTIRERFGEYAFLTPIDTPSTVPLVAGGEIDTRAATCATCHAENHAEWAASTHASAMRDVQFFAEMQKPDQPRWLCLNCHAPTSPQRAELITLNTRLASTTSIAALTTGPNPNFDAARVAEGVTCATCHVRRDADGQGIILGPHGAATAPHRVRKDPAALAGICQTCHSPGGNIVITPTFPCWFETAEEVAAGPDAGKPCTTCHMPQVERPAATDAAPHTVRRHAWTGSGIPKTTGGFSTLLGRGWESGLNVDFQLDPLRVTLTNARAGHALPTGDPERFLRVEASVDSKDGAALATDVLRLGQTWDWGDVATARPAKRVADTRLLPGEARDWTPQISAEGADTLRIEVLSVRLTAANAEGMAGTRLDAQLLSLWPAGQGAIDGFAAGYPLATYVYRLQLNLADGGLRIADAPTLLADSIALAALDPKLRAERLKIPHP
ncbi:hypothetical protein LBMAG42_13090 [Deltaproteobacteria bacterium]|nr:hypothetical protein LBMAG42_13090 [Deltaproteobacteria bacterium]